MSEDSTELGAGGSGSSTAPGETSDVTPVVSRNGSAEASWADGASADGCDAAAPSTSAWVPCGMPGDFYMPCAILPMGPPVPFHQQQPSPPAAPAVVPPPS